MAPSEFVARPSAAALVAALDEAALVLDGDGRIAAWNRAAEARFGGVPAVGLTPEELGPGIDTGRALRLPLDPGVPGTLVVWHAEHPLRGDEVDLQRSRLLALLASSAWHEIAQPLGGLQGFVTMLRLEDALPTGFGVDLQLVVEAARRVEALSRTLTDLARNGARPAGLGKVVAELVDLAGYLLVDVDVRIEIAADAPEVALQPARLQQVIATLLVGEILALGGPRGARGRMGWSVRPARGAEGTRIDLVVEDDAPVVAEADRASLFEALPGPGANPRAGLDLAVARHLLEADGGGLRYEPGPDGGNRLVATLRLVDPSARYDRGPLVVAVPAAVADLAQAAATAPASGGLEAAAATPPELTVLVCDDEDQVRAILARFLERGGIRVLGAASGSEALAVLDREPVDVVMSDYKMSEMSGVELHAAASERHPHLRSRFILMSGDAGDPELVAFSASTGLRVMGKPPEFSTLGAAIREVARA